MDSRWPILTELFAPVFDLCERVLARQRALRPGPDNADGVIQRGENHHFGKADGHMVRMGPEFDGFDHDDQVPHIILVALRLLMTALCVLKRAEKEHK